VDFAVIAAASAFLIVPLRLKTVAVPTALGFAVSVNVPGTLSPVKPPPDPSVAPFGNICATVVYAVKVGAVLYRFRPVAKSAVLLVSVVGTAAPAVSTFLSS